MTGEREPRIVVHVERLVVQDPLVDPRHVDAVREALVHELGRLLAASRGWRAGTTTALRTSMAPPTGGRSTGRLDPSAYGRTLARAVHGQLSPAAWPPASSPRAGGRR